MFPHVNSKDRGLAFAYHWVLVLSGDNRKALLVAGVNLNQPAPAAALNTQQCRIECLLELLLVAPSRLDLFDQLGSSTAFCFR